METYYEQLLERSNRVKNRITLDLKQFNNGQLHWKENEKKWSVIEVVDHLNKVYDTYLDNFEHTLNHAPKLNGEVQKYQRTVLGRLSVFTNKPRGKKRKFKLKTFDFFQPGSERKTNEVIEEFEKKKNTFNGFLNEAGRL